MIAGTSAKVSETRAAECNFGFGYVFLLDARKLSFLLGMFWLSFDSHAVSTETPILMLIDDMSRTGL